MYRIVKVVIPTLFLFSCNAQIQEQEQLTQHDKFVVDYPAPGAVQTDLYLNKIKDKNVALLVNQTSVLEGKHLVDSLIAAGVTVKKVFAPEHGFRGKADAGELVENGTDTKTGLPIISLYGSNKKPSESQLEGIDVVLFDIQDVGCRFYTYISTLTYMMEACAEYDVRLIVLDRPNPNGFVVDGPSLTEEYKSFVGLHNIPVLYGMTIGEYAHMVKGEEWIKDAKSLDLSVIACPKYNRATTFDLPIKPSPNLASHKAVLLYPSLCFFEGTNVSIGRGTEDPFTVLGHPALNQYEYYFTPKSGEGSKYPKHENMLCFGRDLEALTPEEIKEQGLDVSYLLEFYKASKEKNVPFFLDNNFFEKLAGTSELRRQIIDGFDKASIENSWTSSLATFKEMRKPYLIYPD